MRAPPPCCERAVEAQAASPCISNAETVARARQPPRRGRRCSRTGSDTRGRSGGGRRRHSAECRARAQRRSRDRSRHRGRRSTCRRGSAGIHAIGECAEHRGICYGLVEPAYEQARGAGRRVLPASDARYAGSVLAHQSQGRPASTCSRPAISWARPAPSRSSSRDRRPRPLQETRDRRTARLVGAVLFGDTGDGLWYLDLIRSGAVDRGDPR